MKGPFLIDRAMLLPSFFVERPGAGAILIYFLFRRRTMKLSEGFLVRVLKPLAG